MGQELFLQNGLKRVQNLITIISELNPPLEDSGESGYAYSWWTSVLSHAGDEIQIFRADSWGGQAIMVFPELDMVVVFTGGNYSAKSSLFEIIEKYVLPAVQ